MKLIINNSSMQPIYEQICTQIKNKILSGELKQEEMLPSVRTFAKELRVSALTVKRPTMLWNRRGFIVTVHGKGSFVSGVNQELMGRKEKKIKTDLEQAIRKARSCGMTEAEIRELFELILED